MPEIKKIVTLDNIAKFKEQADSKYLSKSKTFSFYYHLDISGKILGMVYPDYIEDGVIPKFDHTYNKYDYEVTGEITKEVKGTEREGYEITISYPKHSFSDTEATTHSIVIKNQTNSFNVVIASEKSTQDMINNKPTGTYSATIPAGTYTFNVHDDNNEFTVTAS